MQIYRDRELINVDLGLWKISWAEEPDGLQSMGSLRVRHN